MATLTVVASGTTSPDNWNLIAGASKVAAIATPDDDNTSYISSTTTDENVQTFTCSPSLPSGATISQIAIRVRARRGGASNASFVVGYSFTPQGGGTQSGESGGYTSTSSWADFTYTHSGLSVNWGSGFTFYLRNTQTRLVYVTSVEVEFTYTAVVIAPAGLAVGAASGGATVWNKRLVVPVTAGDDDAIEALDGEISLISISVMASINYRSGIIFRDVVVPPGASVSEALLQVVPEADYGDDPDLTLAGEIDPADFTTTNSDISDRTLTTATVAWVASGIGTGSYQDSPDISAIIEEIVDDPAWATGDDIGIFLTDNGEGGSLFAHSFNYSGGAYPPRLVIEWDFAPPVLDIAPGGLSVAATIGGPAVGRGAVAIAPDGLGVGVAFGDLTVTPGDVDIAPAGKAVGVAFGTAAVSRTIAPSGLAVAATAGALRVANVVAPDGLAVAAGIGDATVAPGAVAIAPAGLAVAAGIGGAVVTNAGALIRPDGLAVGAGIGDATVTPGAATIAPAGLAVAAGIGTARVGHGLAATGLGVGAAFGTATVTRGIVPIAPTGLAVGATFGTAWVRPHKVVVAASSDGYEDGAGAVVLTTTSLNVNVTTPFVALRVALGSAVPAEATITDAHLELWPITYDDPALESYLELAAAPAALAATSYNLSDRTPTAADAPWVASDVGAGSYVSGPNLSAAMQEAVDLPGWDGTVVVVLRDTGDGGWLRFYSVEAGASFRPRLSVTWSFGPAALDIAPSGKAVAATFGEATITTGGISLTVDAGTAVAVAAGSATVTTGAVGIAVEGLEVAAGIGDATVTGGAEDIAPEGLAVGVAFGTAAVTHGLRLSGLAVGVTAGGLVVGRGAVGVTVDAGSAVGVGIGGPVVSAGGAVIQVSGLAAGPAIGDLVVGRGAVGIAVEGLAVGLALGDAAVVQLVTPDGLAVAVGLGDAAVVMKVRPGGLAVAVGLGAAVVGRGAVDIAPDGLAVGAGIGTAVVGRDGVDIAPAGLAAAVAFGDAAVAIGRQYVRPDGVSVGVIIGTLLVIAATTPAHRIYRVPRRVET